MATLSDDPKELVAQMEKDAAALEAAKIFPSSEERRPLMGLGYLLPVDFPMKEPGVVEYGGIEFSGARPAVPQVIKDIANFVAQTGAGAMGKAPPMAPEDMLMGIADFTGAGILASTPARMAAKQAGDTILGTAGGTVGKGGLSTQDMFKNMGEEGALQEFPEIATNIDKYVYEIDFGALNNALKSDEYGPYADVMRANLNRTFPGDTISVSRIENYSDPRARKRSKNFFEVNKDDVLFVGNESEKELIVRRPDGRPMSVRIADEQKKESLLGGDKPQRFYHGTTRQFENFDPEFKVTTVQGRDFEGSNLKNRGSYYFTPNPEAANFYAKSGKDPRTGDPFKSIDPETGEFMIGGVQGSRVIPVYLKQGNYFDVDNPDHLKTFKESAFYKENKEKLDEKFKFLGADFDTFLKSGEELALEEITPELKKLGFQGHTTYLDGNKNIAVYDTDLIVSGIAKKAKGGTVDIDRSLIRRYSKGGKVDIKGGIGAMAPTHM